jgi:hypothetical protein
MSDDEYSRCKYSVTVHTDDLAVVHCLRALCEFAEGGVKGQIGWGGTKRSEWEKAGNKITLRFSSPAFRTTFVEQAKRLLPVSSWREIARNDNDPAHRQRPPH